MRQDRVDQADGLERPQTFVVETNPARIVDQGVSLVDDQCANPLEAKHIGQRQADRPGTHNDDVVIHRHRPSKKSMCSRSKVLGSSYCGQCPQPSMTSSRAPGIISEIRLPSLTSAVGSSL